MFISDFRPRSLTSLVILWAFISLLNSNINASLTPNTFINDLDRQRLLTLFNYDSQRKEFDLKSLQAQPLPGLYYALSGFSALKSASQGLVSAKEKAELCAHVQRQLSAAGDQLDSIYFATSTAKLLACTLEPDAKISAFLDSQLKTDATTADLHKATLSLINYGKAIDSAMSSRVSKLLQAALKKDDSLMSIGTSFQLAAQLTGMENLAPFIEKISDTIVHADEVNGRMLQFEGGLGVTANLILGVYSLSDAANKPIGLTNDQAIKFANYFLSRKSVQTVKGASELAQVLKLFSTNKHHIPICVTLYGEPVVSAKKPVVTVKITNVLGSSLGATVSGTVESTSLTTAKTLKPVQGDSTLFAIDLFESGKAPAPGQLVLSVSIKSSDAKSKLIGNTKAPLTVFLLTSVKVTEAKLSIVDREQASNLKTHKLTHPDALKEKLEADSQQKLTLKFALTDSNSNQPLSPLQVFVQFDNKISKKEISYVAEMDALAPNKAHKFEINLQTRAKDFDSISGDYDLSLIVGDSIIENGFVWRFASIKLTFGDGRIKAETEKAPWMTAHFEPKPEIKHLFREKEKRPPVVVSDTFSALVLAPFLLLLGLWFKLGVNLSNIRFTLSALLFHGGILAILSLYVCFWVHLDMFQTMKYLIAVGAVTFFSGHRVLSRLSERKD